MALVEYLVPKILKWEGKFVDDPDDFGGATNMGVTIATFKQVFGKDKTVDDLKAMTKSQFMTVLKKFYWDRCKADLILNQSVANIIVDWVWGSGKWGIVIPQRILGVTADGVVGQKTIDAINAHDQEVLFNEIKGAKEQFYRDIVRRSPSQSKFLKGWLNRLRDYTFAQ